MNKFVKKIFTRKFENILFSVGVVCVLVCPLTKINHATKSVSENRNLAVLNNMTSKKYSHGNILKWTKSFEDWLNDRFRGREKIINAYKKWDYVFIGRVENDRALMGKNGWLFYTRKDDGNSLANYQNKTRFTNEELEKIKGNILKQKKLLAAHGIDYYVFIAPDKNRIYGEYYPDYIHKVADKGRAELLVEYLQNEGVDVIYPREELLDAKKNGYIYYPRGTHWNGYGAFIGYKSLMDKMAYDMGDIKALDIDGFEVQKKDMGNTDSMAGWLHLKSDDLASFDNRVLVLKNKKSWQFKTKKKLKKRGGKDYLHNCNEKPMNDCDIAVIRDSFTTAMEPYLSETFKNSYYFWTHNFNIVYPEIFRLKPKIVIHEMVERYIPCLLIEVPKLKE